MKRLPFEQYRQLIDAGSVLATDPHGAKVIATVDGRMVKLFRTKRFFSGARLLPYARRFARNAALLTRRGVRTVEVEGIYRVPEIQRDIVVYRCLEGESLRDAVADGARTDALMAQFAHFLHHLHEQGILFRSLHFGNVLVTASGDLGLIDVADMRTRLFGSLSLHQRMRNFRHIAHYSADRTAFTRFGVDRFIETYAKRMKPHEIALLSGALNRLIIDLKGRLP